MIIKLLIILFILSVVVTAIKIAENAKSNEASKMAKENHKQAILNKLKALRIEYEQELFEYKEKLSQAKGFDGEIVIIQEHIEFTKKIVNEMDNLKKEIDSL